MSPAIEVNAHLRPGIIHDVVGDLIRSEPDTSKGTAYLEIMREQIESEIASSISDDEVRQVMTRAMAKAEREFIASTAKSIVWKFEEKMNSDFENISVVTLKSGDKILASNHFSFNTEGSALLWAQSQVGRTVSDVFMGQVPNVDVQPDDTVDSFVVYPGHRVSSNGKTFVYTGDGRSSSSLVAHAPSSQPNARPMPLEQRKSLFPYPDRDTPHGVWFTREDMERQLKQRQNTILITAQGSVSPSTVAKVRDGLPEAIFTSALVTSTDGERAFVPGVASIGHLIEWFLGRLITPYWGSAFARPDGRDTMVRTKNVEEAISALDARSGHLPNKRLNRRLVAMNPQTDQPGFIRDLFTIHMP